MCEICMQTPCAAGCPNNDEALTWCSRCESAIFAGDDFYEIDDTVYCVDCVYICRRTADRDVTYSTGKPVISYGDKWED